MPATRAFEGAMVARSWPPLRVGVLGAGQLGRMLGLAGVSMGMRMRFLDPADEASAGDVGEVTRADYLDDAALKLFAHGLDAATFEFENVPAEAVERLSELVPVFPPAAALRVAQDREREKTYFAAAGLDVHPWRAVTTLSELEAALGDIGAPAVLKTRRGGYDGKGQAVIRTPLDAGAAWNAIGGKPAIVEKMIAFERELSIIAVRGRDGAFAAYPLVENEHAGGILRLSRAPARGVEERIERAAVEHCQHLMETLGYVGVLAVEFFEAQGRLLANEMAPRVHNSGHWTIEGAVTSQFENHMRAVCGLPLGSCQARGASAMVNLIGHIPDPALVMRVGGAHLHLYAKEPRAGRKVGHVTLVDGVGGFTETLEQRVAAIRGLAGV